MSGEMGQHRLKKVVDYSLLYDFSVLLILPLLSGALQSCDAEMAKGKLVFWSFFSAKQNAAPHLDSPIWIAAALQSLEDWLLP